MAKSPRTGDNQSRRASDKRRAAEQAVAAAPMPATPSKTRSATVRPSGANGVTKEQIAKRAYALFVARGGSHGYDIEDWLQAERELLGGH